MKKIVKEHLDEYWVSSDTGFDRYSGTAQHYDNVKRKEHNNMTRPEQIEEPDENILGMLPPPSIKLTPSEFDDIITMLISMIDESPAKAIAMFKYLLKTHPYLSKKQIGFKGTNEYQNIINRFMTFLKTKIHTI